MRAGQCGVCGRPVHRAGSDVGAPSRAGASAGLRRVGISWAGHGLNGGGSGPLRVGLGRVVSGREEWAGAELLAGFWAGRGREVGCGLGFGFCFGFFLSISIYSLISNLSQTKVEFKYEFEFKPQSIKSMHQHECNKNLNL